MVTFCYQKYIEYVPYIMVTFCYQKYIEYVPFQIISMVLGGIVS